jgi:hypothetical protein
LAPSTSAVLPQGGTMTSTARTTYSADIAPRIRSKTPRRAIAMLSGCVLAGALLTAGPASAASRGFVVHNQSTHVLHLEAVKAVRCSEVCTHDGCRTTIWPIGFEGRPAVGSVLNPRRSERFELKHDFSIFGGIRYAANLWYKVGNTGAKVEYTIYVFNFSNESGCTMHPATAGRCTAEGTKLTFQNG